MTATTIPNHPQSAGPSRLLRDFYLPQPAWWARLPQWFRTSAVLVVLLAVSAYVRTRQINGEFWMDEAIAVGIASHGLTAIPHVLRFDGSPPLYYMLLHVWMQLFGNTEAATHSLSLLCALLTIPISYWGVMTIWENRRMAYMTAFMFALNAFFTGYAQETRMYALMGLLGLLATIGFLAGFVQRRRKFVILFGLSQAAMLYTHAWGLFFGAGTFIALVVLYVIGDEKVRENLVKDVLYAYIGAGVLFLPWLPSFISQSIHTAAPWDEAPRFGAPVQLAQGILGGDTIGATLVICCGVGLADYFVKSGRRTPEATLCWMLIAIPVLTLGLAWAASQVTPAWSVRYFAPTVASILFLAALGMSRAGVLGGITVILLAFMLHSTSAFAPQYKSDVKDISGELGPYLHPGDLVISGQPEETPLMDYYLPGGLRYANTIGPVADPTYFNWIDALPRYQKADPEKVLPPLLNSLKPGQQLLFIRPMTEGAQDWKSAWTELIRLRSAQWGAIIAADKSLVPEPGLWAPHNYFGACCVADSAVLYKKV